MLKKIIKPFGRMIFIFASVVLLFACGGSDKPETGNIEWPEITNETKPWTRWWWHGSSVTERDLTTLMESYQKVGLGGMEITPIYGVRGKEDEFVQFLSSDWMDRFVYTLNEAKRLDLGIDLANASGWPFGGPWIDEEHACKNMVSKVFKLEGGQKLTEAIEYIQQPLVRTASGRRPDVIKSPITDNEMWRYAFDQVRFERALPIIIVTASKASANGFSETIDLTDKVVNGLLDWTAPDGDWTICALFQGDHGKMVERAGPGGEGNVIDHFAAAPLKKYLDRFDEVFRGYDVSYLRHYFNDSYEVDDAMGNSNWTPEFFAEFAKLHGYDLKNHLPAWLGLDTEEMNQRVLYDYRMTIEYLLLERFTKNWQQWAASQGKGIRNQAHGSPANVLDLYAASDIPEIEGRDPINLKSAPSASHVTGKKLTSSEASTWLNEHFLSNLGDVKTDIDRFLLAGVNHVAYHGTTYSPPDAPWPGWVFYASVHFKPENSWWDDFAAFNKYVARAQSFLQAGRPYNDILVYFATADMLSETGRDMIHHMGTNNIFNYPAVRTCLEFLSDNGYSWDAISDRQLMDVSFTKPNLQTSGGSEYKTVIVPASRYMPAGTFEKLVALANDGATVLFCAKLPDDAAGLANLEQNQNKMNELKGKLSFTQNGNLSIANSGKGKIIISDNMSALLSSAGVAPESMYTTDLQCIRRIKCDDNFYYFVKNFSENAFEGWLTLNVNYGSAALYNLMTGADGYAKTRKNSGKTEVFVQLKPQETVVIETFRGNYSGNAFDYYEVSGTQISISGEWNVEFVKGGPTLPEKRTTDVLESWTNYGGEYNVFSGTAEYTAQLPALPTSPYAWRLDLGKVDVSAAVYVNGKYLGTLINAPFTLEIPGNELKAGDELKIKVSNLMANRIADLDKRGVEWRIFYDTNFNARLGSNRGPDGRFSARNWEPLDSGLSGPVTLTPLAKM